MGTIGFTLKDGLTTTDPSEAFTKEMVMSLARQVVVLADSNKAGRYHSPVPAAGTTSTCSSPTTDRVYEGAQQKGDQARASTKPQNDRNE